ncbi:MAG: hypothetical protein PHN78_09245, partial [Dehalococcoidales bacterium]|nr:hypothetical protein [Dehalococcoidales bacterium]
HQKDVILASADMVAIDAVAAVMMGFDPMGIQYISRATELGLGQGDPRHIEIAGSTEAAAERWKFRVGVNLGTGAGMLLWRSPLQVFQKLLFRTPLVNLFIFASEVFHDRWWYPLKGKAIVGQWLRENPWGKLFEEYPG